MGSKGVQGAKHASIDLFKTNDPAYDNIFHKIPRSFDARKKWRHCYTIGEIRDQGLCGSCWVYKSMIFVVDVAIELIEKLI